MLLQVVMYPLHIGPALQYILPKRLHFHEIFSIENRARKVRNQVCEIYNLYPLLPLLLPISEHLGTTSKLDFTQLYCDKIFKMLLAFRFRFGDTSP